MADFTTLNLNTDTVFISNIPENVILSETHTLLLEALEEEYNAAEKARYGELDEEVCGCDPYEFDLDWNEIQKYRLQQRLKEHGRRLQHAIETGRSLIEIQKNIKLLVEIADKKHQEAQKRIDEETEKVKSFFSKL